MSQPSNRRQRLVALAAAGALSLSLIAAAPPASNAGPDYNGANDAGIDRAMEARSSGQADDGGFTTMGLSWF